MDTQTPLKHVYFPALAKSSLYLLLIAVRECKAGVPAYDVTNSDDLLYENSCGVPEEAESSVFCLNEFYVSVLKFGLAEWTLGGTHVPGLTKINNSCPPVWSHIIMTWVVHIHFSK